MQISWLDMEIVRSAVNDYTANGKEQGSHRPGTDARAGTDMKIALKQIGILRIT